MKQIDARDLRNLDMLSCLQGNILKGHGRDNTINVFVSFKKGKEMHAVKWVRNYSWNHVTSFKKQLVQRDLFKQSGVSGDIFSSVFLTREGYKYFGYQDVDKKFTDPAFKQGMRRRRKMTNDPPVKEWETGFQSDVHLLLLLADDDLKRLGLFSKAILLELEEIADIACIEYGNAIRNAAGDGLEHFGYVDGISQPLFLKDEIEAYMARHNTKPGETVFDPSADTNLVLLQDPYAQRSDQSHAFGSYFVFRKLEQNVRGFKLEEENLKLGELGGAYLVGRFEDGTPVTIQADEGMPNAASFNNFDYKDDPSGGRCPHFAHVRKTNTRDKKGEYRKHLMARRGIPYGHRNINTALDPLPAQMPEKGVGLLFMSYQHSIVNQFEFLQKEQANDKKFPSGHNTAIDAIIGQNTTLQKRLYRFPASYGSDELKKEKHFSQFVTMKGGEYFFAPSLSFLTTIKIKK